MITCFPPVPRLLASAFLFAMFCLPAFAQKTAVVGVAPVPHKGVRGGEKAGYIFRKKGASRQYLSRTGLASDPQAAPDGKTLGWVEGQVMLYENKELPPTRDGYPKLPTYFPRHIVLWRNGKTRSITPEKLYEVKWRFVDGGKNVAVGSVGFLGRCFLQLFRAADGKRLQSRTSAEDNLPAWAEAVNLN